jgi:hypothetical protein
VSENTRLNSFVNHFGKEIFLTDSCVLFCKICEVKVAADKKFTVKHHILRNKHINGVELKKKLQQQSTSKIQQCTRRTAHTFGCHIYAHGVNFYPKIIIHYSLL